MRSANLFSYNRDGVHVMAGYYIGDSHGMAELYPYRYFSFSPASGTYSDSAIITLTLQLELYNSSWSGSISSIYGAWLNFFDSSYNYLGYSVDEATFIMTNANGKTVTITIDLSNCQSSYRTSAAYFTLAGGADVYTSVGPNTATTSTPFADSNKEQPFFALIHEPTITAQPSITSMNPTSGQSTTIEWSSASVSNQGNATIYYQYFVGPSSTYNDSYHVGTTTSTSATITEANILAKCGSSFSGTCYIFVRAYWDNGSAQGGWSTPTGRAFEYTPHRTIKYYVNGGWVECIPYYYTGGSWVECIPYYYIGGTWKECSH